MSLFTRIRNIIMAYFNKIIDSAEDPEIMVDQYIKDLEKQLGEVKGWTADVMVTVKKCRANVESTEKKLEETSKLLAAATEADEAEDINTLSALLLQLQDELAFYKTDLAVAEDNEREMRSMHDELSKKLSTYKQKRNLVRSRMAVAKTYNRMADTALYTTDNGEFARMEEKATDIFLKADSMLRLSTQKDPILELKQKYAVKAIEASN